jgi:predicted RNA-binding protein with PUA-like domain
VNYWLVKSDPDSYSINDLEKDKKTIWDGVRNYQARNYLAQMKKSDSIFIYHSGEDKAIVGTALVSKESFQDPGTADERWLAVEIQFKSKLNIGLTLERMRMMPELSGLLLFKQTRLSVMPVTSDEYTMISNLIE